MEHSGIYKIELMPTGCLYVGSAINIARRLSRHKTDLSKNRHCNNYLQHAWNKYGAQAFSFSVIETVDDPKKLVEREQYWMDVLDVCGPSGFNMCPTAGSILGTKKSADSVAKTAAAHRGMKRSAETCAKIREARARQVFSPETRAKRG